MLKNIFIFLRDFLAIKNGGHLTDSEETSIVERTLVVSLTILGVAFSVVVIVLDFFLGFSVYLSILFWISLILCFGILFKLKKGDSIAYSKWFVVLIILFLTNVSWYYDFRSGGQIIYLLFLLYGYLIFMLGNKQLIMVTVLIVVNVGILFFLEEGNYLPPLHLTSETVQRNDAYYAVIIYLIVTYGLMRTVKKNYLNEYQKARESDRLKTTFLSNMSHEIRTPLNAVIGFSNLMLTEEVTPADRKLYKTYINENNRYLLSLVNDILDISMIESNTVQLEEEPCNLNHLILELQKVYSSNLQKPENSNVRILHEMPHDDVYIDIDDSYLERSLKLLMDNAIKFTHEGSVLLGFSLEGKWIRFFVKDTGIGIKDEDMRFLFERFNKLEYSGQKVLPGIGVGLYLVKMIVKMFGGTVSAQSNYGKGSEFSFTIPAKRLRITTGTIPT